MPGSMEFTTAKKRKEPIHFVLDGEEYEFTPHKSAGIMLALADGDYAEVMKQTLDWLGDGLPENQARRIFERMSDEDDEFDFEDVQNLINRLQEQVSGRPSTSRDGLSQRPPKTGRR